VLTFTKGATVTLAPTMRTGLPFSAVGDFNSDGVQELVISQAHPAGANPRAYDGTQSGTLLFLSFTSGLPVDITSQVLVGSLPQVAVPSKGASQTWRRDKEMTDTRSSAQAASISNCSASEDCGLQAYFACCLRIMCTISMPLRIAGALSMDLNPNIGHTRRLMAW
jgi:hypothetical protein